MPFDEKETAMLGARYSTSTLIEQSQISLALAKGYAAELVGKYPDEEYEDLEQLLMMLLVNQEERPDIESPMAECDLVEIHFQSAIKWIRNLVLTADNALQETPEERDEFHLQGKYGCNILKVEKQIKTLIVIAQRFREPLEKWGFSQNDIREGRDILEGLALSRTTLEKSMEKLPVNARDLLIIKGRTFLALKRLERTAKRVFDKDPLIPSKFDLGLLYQKRSKKESARLAIEFMPFPSIT